MLYESCIMKTIGTIKSWAQLLVVAGCFSAQIAAAGQQSVCIQKHNENAHVSEVRRGGKLVAIAVYSPGQQEAPLPDDLVKAGPGR